MTLPPWVMLVTNLPPLAGSWDLLLLTGLVTLLDSRAWLEATLLADLLRDEILTTETPGLSRRCEWSTGSSVAASAGS